MKKIGKARLEVLKLAKQRGYMTFADMKQNQIPVLIRLGLMEYAGNTKKILGRSKPKYILTEKGHQFLEGNRNNDKSK